MLEKLERLAPEVYARIRQSPLWVRLCLLAGVIILSFIVRRFGATCWTWLMSGANVAVPVRMIVVVAVVAATGVVFATVGRNWLTR